MPQQARQGQQDVMANRRQLTREEAIEIAKKSYQRMRAQNTAQPPLPPTPPPVNKKEEAPKGIQIQLVKRQPQSTPTRPVSTPPRNVPQPPLPREPEYEYDSEPATEPEHLTRGGQPDRRFSENRAMPTAKANRDIVGVHLTKSGRPDRRYLENQHLSQREAEIERAKAILRQAGIKYVD